MDGLGDAFARMVVGILVLGIFIGIVGGSASFWACDTYDVSIVRKGE